MQTCTLTATKSRLIYLLPTEGSSSRTRSAYEKYLFASQMSNYAVKHGAQVLPLSDLPLFLYLRTHMHFAYGNVVALGLHYTCHYAHPKPTHHFPL
jgi:hypothetical protein